MPASALPDVWSAKIGRTDRSQRLRGAGSVVGDGTYLRISEVLAHLREAGFPESESTVRRMIDKGELKSYRIGTGGHRRITAASVDDYLAKRRLEIVDNPPEKST